MRRSRFRKKEAELDITSFMNLMIILVPVLLMSMVFSHISVLDLTLPDLSSDTKQSKKNDKKEGLELVIEKNRLLINYPAGNPRRSLSKITDTETGDLTYDFKSLAAVLREIKRNLKLKGINKKDILILSQPDTDYQTIVRAMDTVRSFKAVVVTDVVDAELFPVVSLGDAPVRKGAGK